MATKGAQPLCSTCSYHEKQSGRINFMWGAGWAFVLIIGTIVTILMTGQDKNSKKIDANTNRIVQHERVMNESIHSVEQALTVISINQKRQMEDVGLKYLDPERVKTYYYDKEK